MDVRNDGHQTTASQKKIPVIIGDHNMELDQDVAISAGILKLLICK
jgi:hypothetical protein